MSIIWAFDNIENKHDIYRGEYCMKKICESLKVMSAKLLLVCFFKSKRNHL